MGSFIPPLYYGFYCSRVLKIVYICLMCSLGILCIIVSLWDKFNAPEYRLLRAGNFFYIFFRSDACSVFLIRRHVTKLLRRDFFRKQNVLSKMSFPQVEYALGGGGYFSISVWVL